MVGADGQTVSAWNDALGGSISFVKNDSYAAPTFSSEKSIGGYAAVYFSTDSVQRLTSADSFPVAPKTIFIVSQNDVYTSVAEVFGVEGEDRGIRTNAPGGNNYFGYGNGGALDYVYLSSGTYYGTLAVNGETTPNVDGRSVGIAPLNQSLLVSARGAEATVKQMNGQKLSIGSYSTYGRRFRGSMTEIVAFDFALTDVEMKVVNTLLATKYGLNMKAGSVYDYAAPTHTKGLFYLGKTAQEDADDADYFNVVSNGSYGLTLDFKRASGSGEIFVDGNGILVGNNSLEEISWDNSETNMPEMVAASREWFADSLDSGELFMEIDDTLLTLTFSDELAGGDTLLYRSTASETYSVFDKILAVESGDGTISFTLRASDFELGKFYTVGHVPEPSTGILFLGLLAGWFLIRGKKSHDV
ncbi:MAG: PEP-CTERM sorting domain-containing protein [Planctomycetia bacterium]|nr:PEP-CTERM sorting domain-containing protein [Planctomycetia bacterium]